jgi:hypothetical protein
MGVDDHAVGTQIVPPLNATGDVSHRQGDFAGSNALFLSLL